MNCVFIIELTVVALRFIRNLNKFRIVVKLKGVWDSGWNHQHITRIHLHLVSVTLIRS